MSPYEGGIHGEVEAGAIDLGVIVTDGGVGLALDAPGIGSLRAAFDVLVDGSTKLTALSREGVPVVGLTDPSKLAELQAELDAKAEALQAAQQRVSELEATLAEHDAEAERRLQAASAAEGERDASQKSLAETEARLRRAQTELGQLKSTLSETEAKLRAAQTEGATTGAAADEVRSRFNQSQAELTATRKTLSDVEGRLRRLQTQHDMQKNELDARVGAAAAEVEEITTRLQAAEAQAGASVAELDRVRAELAQVTGEKEIEAERASSIEVERDEALRQLQQAEDGRSSDLGRVQADFAVEKARAAEELRKVKALLAKQVAAEKQRAADELKASEEMSAAAAAALAEKASNEKSRADHLEAELKQLQELSARQRGELDEERSRRDEMVRDLAYIQSQVSDLSSTKGALVSRVKAMTDRESRRQRTSAEMTDAVRTAEVVAADTKYVARREQARAQKLEDQVRGMTAEIVEWRGRAEVAENSVLMLGEQLTQTTKERDALRIDVGFFQKQIGALQRAAAQEKLKPKK